MSEKMNRQGNGIERQKRREWGQSLLETAVILPILLLILAIVIDAARAFDAMTILTSAVRQGARFASLEPGPLDETEIFDMVVLDIEGSGTNVSQMTDFGERGTVTLELAPAVAVTVTASYDFPLWFGRLLGFDTWTLEKSAVIRHTEQEGNP